MKKKFFYSALFLMGMAFTSLTAASCSDDDGNNGKYGHGCQDAARDLALTLNGRSGVGRLVCHGTQ